MGWVSSCRCVFIEVGQCVFWHCPSLSIYSQSWITGFTKCQLPSWVSCKCLVVADKGVILWSQIMASWDFCSKGEERSLDLDFYVPFLRIWGTPNLECTISELETIYQQFIPLPESLESVFQTVQLFLCLKDCFLQNVSWSRNWKSVLSELLLSLSCLLIYWHTCFPIWYLVKTHLIFLNSSMHLSV